MKLKIHKAIICLLIALSLSSSPTSAMKNPWDGITDITTLKKIKLGLKTSADKRALEEYILRLQASIASPASQAALQKAEQEAQAAKDARDKAEQEAQRLKAELDAKDKYIAEANAKLAQAKSKGPAAALELDTPTLYSTLIKIINQDADQRVKDTSTQIFMLIFERAAQTATNAFMKPSAVDPMSVEKNFAEFVMRAVFIDKLIESVQMLDTWDFDVNFKNTIQGIITQDTIKKINTTAVLHVTKKGNNLAKFEADFLASAQTNFGSDHAALYKNSYDRLFADLAGQLPAPGSIPPMPAPSGPPPPFGAPPPPAFPGAFPGGPSPAKVPGAQPGTPTDAEWINVLKLANTNILLLSNTPNQLAGKGKKSSGDPYKPTDIVEKCLTSALEKLGFKASSKPDQSLIHNSNEAREYFLIHELLKKIYESNKTETLSKTETFRTQQFVYEQIKLLINNFNTAVDADKNQLSKELSSKLLEIALAPEALEPERFIGFTQPFSHILRIIKLYTLKFDDPAKFKAEYDKSSLKRALVFIIGEKHTNKIFDKFKEIVQFATDKEEEQFKAKDFNVIGEFINKKTLDETQKDTFKKLEAQLKEIQTKPYKNSLEIKKTIDAIIDAIKTSDLSTLIDLNAEGADYLGKMATKYATEQLIPNLLNKVIEAILAKKNIGKTTQTPDLLEIFYDKFSAHGALQNLPHDLLVTTKAMLRSVDKIQAGFKKELGRDLTIDELTCLEKTIEPLKFIDKLIDEDKPDQGYVYKQFLSAEKRKEKELNTPSDKLPHEQLINQILPIFLNTEMLIKHADKDMKIHLSVKDRLEQLNAELKAYKIREATIILLSLIAEAHPEVYCTLQAPAPAVGLPSGPPPLIGAGPPPAPLAGGVGVGGLTLVSDKISQDYLTSLNALMQSKPAFRNTIMKNIVNYRNFLKIFDSVVASGIFNRIKDDVTRITQARYDFKEILESLDNKNIKAYNQFVEAIAQDFTPLKDILANGTVVPGITRKIQANDLIEGMFLKIDAVEKSQVKDKISDIKNAIDTRLGALAKVNNATKMLFKSSIINYLDTIKQQLSSILQTPHDKQEFKPEDYSAQATAYQNKHPRNLALIPLEQKKKIKISKKVPVS